MKKLSLLAALSLAIGCGIPERRSNEGGGGGEPFPYDTLYEANVSEVFSDNTGFEESSEWVQTIEVIQDGHAATLAGILSRVTEDGFESDYNVRTITLIGPWEASYSVSTDESPFLINLRIEGEYPDLAYEYEIDYVIELGTPFDV